MSDQDYVLPELADILEIHKRALARSGGAPGVRDPDAIAAALARPRQLLAYHEHPPSLFLVGAALAASFCRIRHPFVDGNKRVALGAASWFLWLNGWRLDATERDVTNTVRSLSEGSIDEQHFADWLQRNSWRR